MNVKPPISTSFIFGIFMGSCMVTEQGRDILMNLARGFIGIIYCSVIILLLSLVYCAIFDIDDLGEKEVVVMWHILPFILFLAMHQFGSFIL